MGSGLLAVMIFPFVNVVTPEKNGGFEPPQIAIQTKHS
jgi:hypothetical protein